MPRSCFYWSLFTVYSLLSLLPLPVQGLVRHRRAELEVEDVRPTRDLVILQEPAPLSGDITVQGFDPISVSDNDHLNRKNKEKGILTFSSLDQAD